MAFDVAGAPAPPRPASAARPRRPPATRSSTSTVTRMPPASRVARLPPRSRAAIRPSQPPDRLRARSPRRQVRSHGRLGRPAPPRRPGVARGSPRPAPARRRATAAVSVSRSSARAGRRRPRRAGRLDDPLGLGPGGADRLGPLAAGPAPLLLGDPQRVGRPQLGGPGAIEQVAGLGLGRPDRREGRLERALRLGQARARVGHDRLGQAEPLGDREGLAAAGQPDRQAIGRRQRVEVELDGRVASPRAWCARRPSAPRSGWSRRPARRPG